MATRFLLDEQIRREAAVLTARRGVDAEAVHASPRLRGLDARSIQAESERASRVPVTYNVRHFVPLLSERIAAGVTPPGLVFVDEGTIRQGDLRRLAEGLVALAGRIERGEGDVPFGYRLRRGG